MKPLPQGWVSLRAPSPAITSARHRVLGLFLPAAPEVAHERPAIMGQAGRRGHLRQGQLSFRQPRSAPVPFGVMSRAGRGLVRPPGPGPPGGGAGREVSRCARRWPLPRCRLAARPASSASIALMCARIGACAGEPGVIRPRFGPAAFDGPGRGDPDLGSGGGEGPGEVELPRLPSRSTRPRGRTRDTRASATPRCVGALGRRGCSTSRSTGGRALRSPPAARGGSGRPASSRSAGRFPLPLGRRRTPRTQTAGPPSCPPRGPCGAPGRGH